MSHLKQRDQPANTHNSSNLTDFDQPESNEEIKSDESTKRADQIVRNINLNKLWGEDDGLQHSSRDINDVEFEKEEEDELSSIDPKQQVDTITEENEPDSNISTLINDSALNSPVKKSECQPDQMETVPRTERTKM